MTYYRRFDPLHRILHFWVVVSFLGLAVTGLPLKYAQAGWAHTMAQMLGGFQALGFFHRVFAVITLGYFFVHLGYAVNVFRLTRKPALLLGPDSMVPSWRDFRDLAGHLVWFLGLGLRPRFERWTYWEKFDYWAVWWGVLIIGSSGLVLWFPTWFAQFFPGWVCNIAMIIHSDEALLAAGFIFTVHFFNGHLRPGKFPMDTAIFTGAASQEELAEDHPAWLERLEASGRLEQLQVEPPSGDFLFVSRVFGALALALGVVMISLVIFAALAG